MNKMIPYLRNALLTLLWDILANIGVSSHISNSENATSLQENNHYFRIAINQVTLPKCFFYTAPKTTGSHPAFLVH